MPDDNIKKIVNNICLVCQSSGRALYSGLKDQLFSAPGQWDMSVCDKCGFIWLNPYPAPEELGKMYETYYTHAAVKRVFFPAITKFIERQALSTIGYGRKEGLQPLRKITGHLPIISNSIRMAVLGIDASWGARLLDVGAGNGEFLNLMKSKGWMVEGTEFDPKAADFAEKRFGLKVHVGDLLSLNLPENSYDVVTLNHVIEHVYNPERFLAEIHRILRPGGRVVLLTPNTQSLGYRLFAQNWRGLEVPRHLGIFSVDNLAIVVERVGFELEKLTSTARIARYLYSTSTHMKQGRVKIGGGGNRGYWLALKSYGFQAFEEIHKVFNSNKSGEEIYYVGRKKI